MGIERHPTFWQGTLRVLYPYAAEELIAACKKNPNAVASFLENDLDHGIEDTTRKEAIKRLLSEMRAN